MALARKVCLLGDFSVGKTSLIRRYIHDDFSLDYKATVGVQVHEHKDDIDIDGETISFTQVIWDIEGTRFGEDLVTSYLLGSAGALIVGDAMRSDVVPSMISHTRKFMDALPGRPVVFAINKVDLVDDRGLSAANQLVDSYGGDVLRTSALTGESVRSSFRALARRIVDIGA